MNIERGNYLDKLIAKKHNGLIKIVTGIRRCGKSYLLFTLFRQYLLDSGVAENHILSLALDDFKNRKFLNPEVLYDYILSAKLDDAIYYVLLDEIQLVANFESVLNGLMRYPNLDIYVTGSNSKFLSSDIITEFRGRGDEIRMYPLSFSEYFSVANTTFDRDRKSVV